MGDPPAKTSGSKHIRFLFCLSPHLDSGVDSILISETVTSFLGLSVTSSGKRQVLSREDKVIILQFPTRPAPPHPGATQPGVPHSLPTPHSQLFGFATCKRKCWEVCSVLKCSKASREGAPCSKKGTASTEHLNRTHAA